MEGSRNPPAAALRDGVRALGPRPFPHAPTAPPLLIHARNAPAPATHHLAPTHTPCAADIGQARR